MKSNRSCAVGIAIGITVLCLASVAIAEDPYEVAWTAQIGTSGDDEGNSVTVDGSGNIYICGSTGGDFVGASAGMWDAFLTKLDPSGNELWSQQIGTASSDYGHGVAVDISGNIYISGSTYGDLGGQSNGGFDAYLSKFSPSGDSLWSRQIGTGYSDSGSSVAVDALGNVYISGSTQGDLAHANAGSNDAYLAKFSPSGDSLWSRQIGTTGSDGSYVSVDAAGNAFISGYTQGDLGGLNAGNLDAFLTKFDPSGNELWSKQIGTATGDYGRAVATDTFGNAFVSGWTYGDLGGTNAGHMDAFLTKFDASGNELWSQQIGTQIDDKSFSVAVDGSGNAYISGFTDGDLVGTNAGDEDAFLTKFDPLGNELWSQQIGTPGIDRSYSVSVDPFGNPYISGYTGGDLGGANAGGYDAFLVKFEAPIPEPATMSLLALGGVAVLRQRKK